MMIFINPGHSPGGNPDPGAVNTHTGLRESDVAMDIGNMVVEYLQAAGCEAVAMQSDDLRAVVDQANALQADLFISIHCNSAENELAQGSETWYFANSVDGKEFAECIQTEFVSALSMVDRGIKTATPGISGLYVLTNTDMPAVLVETAFISNYYDEQLLAEPETRDDFAAAIARGITDFMQKQE